MRKKEMYACCIGILLGVLMASVFGFIFAEWKWAVFFFVVFSVAGAVCTLLRKTQFEKYLGTVWALWSLFCVAVLVLLPFLEIFSWGLLFMYDFMRVNTPENTLLLNALLVMSLMLLAFFIVGNWRISTVVISTLLSVFVIVNGFVYRFRGKEIIFPDLLSTGTALNVAGNYDWTLPFHSFLTLSLVAFLIFVCFSLPSAKKPQKRGLIRVVAFLMSASLLLGLNAFAKNLECITWNWDGTLRRGFYLNFCLSVRDNFVAKPEAYSKDELEMLYQRYSNVEEQQAELPHVLVIMNEAFADFDVFGKELDTAQPVLPFYNSLKENTIRGYALSSVYGGNTANSEFEFLTGFTMSFLPEGSVPYQQYINYTQYSLPAIMDSLGYHSYATHPYIANGWNRPKVYPLLGFEESSFEEAYLGEDRIRGYISDREMYNYIFDRLENAKEPQFVFGITMQNHGGYGEGIGKAEFTPRGISGEYPDVEEYFTLLNHSDKALEALITKLQGLDRRVVVLLYGDHFPNLDGNFYDQLQNGKPEDLNSRMLGYKVPFLVWANYDIPEQQVECTSLNYLGRYLLDAAGIDLPAYYKFLRELEEVIPAINAMGYYSVSKGEFLPCDIAEGEEAEWMNQYRRIQYNGLFDREKSSFFKNQTVAK